MAKLIVFLGNPGVQYKKTRHNTARMFCDSLNLNFNWQTKFNGTYAKTDNTVWLCPETYMNESGVSVQKASAFFNIEPQDILIIHDDIELKFGETKLQLGGGMGGHNGLRSVKQYLGTEAFYRLRLGIGRPEHGDVASFVLGKFTELEEHCLEDTFAKAKKQLESFL